MDSTPSAPVKGWYRASISLLSAALATAGLSNSASYADDGITLPDSTAVRMYREIRADTVYLYFQNPGIDSIQHLFVSDFTDSPAVTLECIIDDEPNENEIIEREFGTVYPDMYTTRWLIGAFARTVMVKFYSPVYTSCRVSWSAGLPEPIFGFSPDGNGIGPPVAVGWRQ